MHIHGLNVNYYDKGSGNVILFLHGWGSHFMLFGDILDSLTSHYRVLALDFPGCGGTPEPPQAWTLDDYCDFVTAFLQERGVERVILLGHSHGGRVSIQLAARAALPFAITKLILVDSAGVRAKRTTAQKSRTAVYKTVRNLLSVRWVEEQFPEALEAWRARHGSADYNAASPIMRETLVNMVNMDLTHLMPLIGQPVLLIWGERDDATPLSDAKTMERLFPDAGLVVLPGAGHYSFLEQKYTFMRVLDSFLGVAR
jgi:Predicted hydrolases or acyltransferases (alpha/beta hydrolase superfamily)